MSQYEILEHLKQNQNEWFSARTISKELDKSIGTTTVNIKKLLDFNLVIHKIVVNNRGQPLRIVKFKKW